MPFMLSEKESGVLRDMLFHVDAAERFAHGQTFESLRDDLMRLYAIIRSLEIISRGIAPLIGRVKGTLAGHSVARNGRGR
jgi:uncharacterized protein with HEPN domain